MSELINGVVQDQPLQGAPNVPHYAGSANPTVDNSQQTQQPNVQPTAPVSEIEIEGLGRVKIDEVKEWKQGHLRQSDYTRKTQEIAKQRQENKDALELYNYIKNNPHIAQAVSQGDFTSLNNSPVANKLNPESQRIDELSYKMANIELDNTLNSMKSRYGEDFNEVEVLQEADRLGIGDLEFVYNALQGKKIPTLREQLKKEIESSIASKIQNNANATSTIIGDNDVGANVNVNHGLSSDELRVAQKMGLTPERYAKAKSMHL